MTQLLINARNKKMYTNIFPIHEPWMDIGQKNELDLARKGINL